MGGMLFLMLLLGTTGNRLGGDTARTLMEMRKEAFERWMMFARMAVDLALDVVWFFRGVPKTIDKTTNKESYTNEAILKLVRDGREDDLLYKLIKTALDKLLDLLGTLLKPSALESQILGQLMGGGNATGPITPNQVRAGGGIVSGRTL